MNTKKNISVSLIIKLISITLGLISVPLLIKVLGTENYGTWVTLTSLIGFAGVLDFGVGNSLVNTFSKITDLPSFNRAKEEFSHILKFSCFVALVLVLIFGIATKYVLIIQSNTLEAIFIYIPVILAVPLMLYSSVLQGRGKIALHSFFSGCGNWIFVALIFSMLFYQLEVDILTLAFFWGIIYFFVALIQANFVARKNDLSIALIFDKFDLDSVKHRLQVGFKFLILQVSSLVLYGIGNILVYTKLGPGEVAKYDVVNKIFLTGLGLYSIVISMAWAKIGQAIAHGNKEQAYKILTYLWISVFIFGAGALFIAIYMMEIVTFWTRGEIMLGDNVAYAIAALVTIQAGAYVGAVFLNALEKINVQIYISFGAILLMIPLSNFFFKSDYGITSVPYASIILTVPAMVACNIFALRYIKIMDNVVRK